MQQLFPFSSTQSSSSSFSLLTKGLALTLCIFKHLDRGRGRLPRVPGTAKILLSAMAFSLVSCNNDKIEVYNIPKEGTTVAMQSGSEGLAPPPPGNPAQWTKPEGWNEQPLSEMRLGSFKVAGANAATAD